MSEQQTNEPVPVPVPPGLRGVVVAETQIGDVRGEEGFFHYRQYSAIDLAQQCSLEEIWHLLVIGHLPDVAELREFSERTAAERTLPDGVRAALPAVVEASARPTSLDGLRTVISLAGAELGMRPLYDLSEIARVRDGIRLTALVPTLVAALYRLSRGLEVVEPSAELGHVANYLYMLTGEIPCVASVDALASYLAVTVDHGFNASTFATRVVASTGADTAAAVVAGIGALSGPLHGGAPSRVLDMLDEIGRPEHARSWARERVEAGDRVMGFGHAVYRTADPRSVLLEQVARRYGGQLVDLATATEQAVVETLDELKPGRGLSTNVEYYASVVMSQVGLERELFTPTFAVARTIGWAANILEQARDPRIVRPSARYVGEQPPQHVPSLSER